MTGSSTEERKLDDKLPIIKGRKRKSTDLDRGKSSNNTTHKSNSLEKLRAERLLREQTEKLRTEALLAKLRGDPIPVVLKEEPKLPFQQKYHSQFFPELARQNVVKNRK